MKNLLQLNEKEARDYFLNEKRYCTLDLPEYYSFDGVLKAAAKWLGGKSFHQVLRGIKKADKPCNFEGVNYVLVNNKKAKFKWRKIDLIHPVFYVGIANEITEKSNWKQLRDRFGDFKANERITYCSIPIIDTRKKSIVLNWWGSFEQQSIANSIDYTYMGTTDIENCYPSIYTHSIAWAIHTKAVAKANQDKYSFLGNKLDEYIRNMQNGQTNGIPQGSVLMDFIAELVLGYADELLTSELEEAGIRDYKILRYRDDYRIFANEITVIEEVIKHLAIVLTSLNLNISAEKTHISDNIISDSIKRDKLYRITHPIDGNQTLQKRLLCIYELGLEFPNSGSLKRELTNIYNNDFSKMDKRPNSYEQLLSIVLEIMHRNPDTYPLCVGILSEIFKFLNSEAVKAHVQRILQKFRKEPFSDYLEVWLQRTTLYHDRDYEYNCELCRKVYEDVSIWNSIWMDVPIDESTIIQEEVIADITPNLSKAEVDVFSIGYDE